METIMTSPKAILLAVFLSCPLAACTANVDAGHTNTSCEQSCQDVDATCVAKCTDDGCKATCSIDLDKCKTSCTTTTTTDGG